MKLSVLKGRYRDEPAVALVNRRAVQNGITSIKDAWSFATERIKGFDHRSDEERIAYRCGAEAKFLKWSTPTTIEQPSLSRSTNYKPGSRVVNQREIPFHSDEYVQLMGNTFRAGQIDRSLARWCPACLADKPYYRSIWSIKSYRTCVTHRLPLQSACPSCKEDQRWPTDGFPRDVKTCKCGTSLSYTPTIEHKLEDVSAFDRWLFTNAPNQIGYRRKEQAGGELLTDGMPYHYALEVFKRLGAYALRPIVNFQDTSAANEEHSLMLRGLEASSKASFTLLLDQISVALAVEPPIAAGRTNAGTLEATYGQLAKWLLAKRQVPPFEAMIDALLEHSGEPHPTSAAAGGLIRTRRNALVTAAHAAEILHVGLTDLWETLMPLGYVLPRSVSPAFPIPLHLLSSLKRPGEVLLGLREVAHRLSVPEALAREMLKMGCLVAEVPQARSRRTMVSPLQVAQLLDALQQSFLSGREGSPLVSLLKAKAPIGRGELLMLVLEGRLHVRDIRRGYPGLARFMVAQDEVERAVEQQTGAVRIREAMRLLSMNELEVSALIKDGRIGLLPGSRTKMLIRADVMYCAQVYIGERTALRDLDITRSRFRKIVLKSNSKPKSYILEGDALIVPRATLEKISTFMNRKYGLQLKLAI